MRTTLAVSFLLAVALHPAAAEDTVKLRSGKTYEGGIAVRTPDGGVRYESLKPHEVLFFKREEVLSVIKSTAAAVSKQTR